MFFEEVLLMDGSDLIYSSIISNDQEGFNSDLYDFQFILLVNSTQTTHYYFFVELD